MTASNIARLGVAAGAVSLVFGVAVMTAQAGPAQWWLDARTRGPASRTIALMAVMWTNNCNYCH